MKYGRHADMNMFNGSILKPGNVSHLAITAQILGLIGNKTAIKK
jgi:hypothetical protein